jgi:ABC-2 type transport system ATP-binding protein
MENLQYFGSIYGINGKKATERANYLLTELGLSEKKNVSAANLSGGMKRRLNLACALMQQPKLIILDEPTTGLDPTTRNKMWNTVVKLAKDSNAAVLLTTHYMEEAEALCQRIVFINAGQTIAEGTPDMLKKMVGNEMARVRSVPGHYESLEPEIKKINGVTTVTVTDHGLVIEAADLPKKINKITEVFENNNENIVGFSVSKPSLEDVFLKLTGAQLKGGQKNEPSK